MRRFALAAKRYRWLIDCMTEHARRSSLTPVLYILVTAIALSTLVSIALVRFARAVDGRPETQAMHEHLTELMDSIRLPSDLRLQSSEAGGSTVLLDHDPWELRIYETDRDLPRLSQRVSRELELQGFSIGSTYECEFEAMRGRYTVFVSFARQPVQLAGAGRACPTAAWSKGYVWLSAGG